ncbi:MAG: zinc-ribbon domain containing protein [Candidatus Zixiibacteriota bacterium]
MDHRFQPRVLICSECGEEFAFTAEAQQYFAERGYTEDPKRCRSCHTQHKRMQRQPHGHATLHDGVKQPD